MPGFLDPLGEFSFEFSVRELRRHVGRASTFSMAFLLAGHERGRVAWKAVDAVISGSHTSITLPGSRELTERERVLNSVSSIDPQCFDPLPLIRAVNVFWELGMVQALAELKAWARTAGSFGTNGRCYPNEKSLDMSDRAAVLMVAAILFEPRLEEASFPPFPRVCRPPGVDLLPAEDRVCFPLLLRGDVPLLLPECDITYTSFFLASQGLQSEFSDVVAFLDWCESNCTLREEPLHPVADPSSLLDETVSDPAMLGYLEQYGSGRKQAGIDWNRTVGIGQLRCQVLRLLRNVLELEGWDLSDRFAAERLGRRPSPYWRAFGAQITRPGIRWDAAGQVYRRE